MEWVKFLIYWKKNGSPKADFNVGLLTAFSVVVREPEEQSFFTNCSPACH
jgi:hypothetical protein